jgi:RNA exonuclease NGL2
MSCSLLAQGLVRRKLFPGSDCLKWKDREAGLRAELVGHAFDIACFQEVDRLDSHGPNLEKAGFKFVYEKGYAAKQHGLRESSKAVLSLDTR